MVGNLSLYAAHLPLDGHLELGNAAQIATALGGVNVKGFCEHRGRTVGVRCDLQRGASIEALAETLRALCSNGPQPLLLPFGSRDISSIAIVTGSGSSAISECSTSGIDLLISGEPKQEVYHRAKELQCSAIFIGHYASETFGVRALKRVLAERFRVETEWIDEPTGI
jgi:putative NIF3 family GTP cyclohydrolase 1 type 2